MRTNGWYYWPGHGPGERTARAMDFLTSDTFVTIFSVVGSAIGLFLAVRADIAKRIDRLEDRTDRVEERARADHKEVVAAISELKTAVSVVSAKLDERSSPRRLVIQEPPADYPVDDESEDDPETR